MKSDILIAGMCLALTTACSGADADNEAAVEPEESLASAAGTETAAAEPEPVIEGPSLATALNFSNTANCEWGDAAERIFEEDTVFGDDYVSRPGTVSVPGIESAITAELSRPDAEYPEYVEVRLDFKGEWLGLQVVGLTDAFFEESGGVFGRGIRFDASVDEVVAALGNAGFDINADGSERSRALTGPDYEGANAVTSVDAIGSETVFSCNQVYEGL